MGPRNFLHFLVTWTCVFFFSCPSVCSGQDTPKIRLERTVFVAVRGDTVIIEADLQIPANQSRDVFKCFDPSDQKIDFREIDATANQPVKLKLEFPNMTSSGEYCCQYNIAKVYWFLRLRDKGYTEPITWNHTEVIVAIFTGVLLVFSLAGSVYVFRGNWKGHITDCRDPGTKPEQNGDQRRAEERQEDNVDDVTDPSTSFYASLECRPRSIYDVLDRSAVREEPDPGKAKTKKKEPKQTVEQTTQNQNDGVFESVYENF
ncbi:uncharacterized protein si:ch211-243a20.4 isoform X1 [Xyrichtys novacula]|uniref:Uncharacterized protein si:ch211-243a20.4 isoform X1 n=1 Tax=Xyrichtys novacula TaxID=13765 RepID=A0AAV1EY52_XYRNO|nr:uncharacterized protein si:ch211-243a20.4 isoform X1 [Xyrichtys novacula]